MDILAYGESRSVKLQRFPLRKDNSLRAWDNADRFILQTCEEQELLSEDLRILIVNDSFGALSVALAGYQPYLWNDSLISLEALHHNLTLNNYSHDLISFIPGHEQPEGRFDLVLLKFPKSMVLWEDHLLKLRPHLHSGTKIISGGMIKHSPKTAFDLLGKCIGPTTTSLGWKKARLAFSDFDSSLECAERVDNVEYVIDKFKLTMTDGANLFSRGKLDMGTNLLLSNLPETQRQLRTADLGSGNGVVALALARLCPKADVFGIDESYQAVECANQNAIANGLEHVKFRVASGIGDMPQNSLDLIVCNPPFHQGQNVGDSLAWDFFTQAKRALDDRGELFIVGNRHLGYHIKLTRLFGECSVVASNAKFVVLRAVK
ncbi:methyltransferase [bacterium]|nr:methyltransferase [bacterium]